ncbi:ATP-binding cassette sub-family A member 9 [Camelus dromedarius]|uniref:ATP-binding cassette sub-family A member 9 n=1 Tax=Camelus dromedarius TaxID=9838 RepID=A0A5N4D4B0_CAMDR|nr:ATP-binding cassette sub-family A member 9 [Camelus dromedarius]
MGQPIYDFVLAPWEWFFSLLLVLFAYLFSSSLHQVNDFHQLPAVDLGRVDDFNDSNYVIALAPESKTTQEIMNKVASAPFMKGRTIMGWPDEKSMDELDLNYSTDAVRVIFNDTFLYHLKFLWGDRIPKMKEHRDHSAHCQVMDETITCESSVFWEKGFVAFQAAINAAIVEVSIELKETNCIVNSVLMDDRNKSFSGGKTDVSYWHKYEDITLFNVTLERRYMKSLMTMMGLQESAFWLSWGLMYSGFTFITATLMALIVKSAPVVILTGFMVVFTLFLLYGMSLITLAFLMRVLVKKPSLTGLAVFLLTVFWGSLGFTALYRHLPAFLEWTLCLLSPFAFTAGMAQFYMKLNLVSEKISYDVIIIKCKVKAEYGRRHSPWFFLKSSFWFQHQRADHAALENETDLDSSTSDPFEPVSPEFHGKEAVRIRNLRKEYGRGKHAKVEALKGLVFDIYEGQITALLGRSGAGKTTLLNVLSGLLAPTSAWDVTLMLTLYLLGSVTIYNHSLSETADPGTISRLTGACPQPSVQFGFLTARENLRLFAQVKGIQPHEVAQEVQRVLRDLEMENIQDILAQHLSGGQKRKLTLGIAFLGDPQVLLLDEPTAGSDPLSRHHVWNLLKERKSDRVILFSTQFMDEADILADRKVFISSGRLKCAGSSLFLKKKWGIGYHLSLHLNEMCDPDGITSLVKQHIPDAKLAAQSEEKLKGNAQLRERVKKNQHVDLYRDLDRRSYQGIENYGVSVTTLNEVFLKLEGKSGVDEPDIGIWGQLQSDRTNDTGSLVELEQVLSSLNKTKSAVSGMALWRQQLWAMAKVRFLKLKKERRTLLTMKSLESPYYGSSIDDFIHSLRQQNIALEVDAFGTRSGPDEPSYNGAITVSGDDRDHRFSIACNTKRLNCFPVLLDIISNGLLGIFNSSEHIETDRSNFEKKAHSQLRISGLCPSVYWFGQALVDVPLFFLILLLMQIVDSIFSPEEVLFIIQSLLVQILCSIGYVSSLIFLTYVISFIFCSGRKNSGIWSFFFLIITIFSMVASKLNEYGFLGLLLCTMLIPTFTLIGSLFIFSEISPDSVDYLGASEQQIVFLALLIPYLHFFTFLFVLRCLEMNFRKKLMRKDPVFRISPRSSSVLPNPEKPEGEDDDVQMERMRTANAVTAPDSDEVLLKGRGRGDALGFLGYCPQENARWPSLTVQEHLEVFAAVKGLRKADAAAAITRYTGETYLLVDVLKLQEQLKLPMKALSEGVKRKLCFALSLLGNPSVVLLDEPSTGMDPEGQLQMWQATQATIRNTERGALLTTHYMAEAEAVCDRVAIMVSGRLRCVGSIQHLKSKFGKDYLLEMKVKTLARVESLHGEILRVFPHAARQERFSSLMVYRLPVEDVRPLSQAFFKLEAVKRSFDLEEYSLSQSTLEQVFLELSKEQELDGFDEEVDLSIEWKLLQGEP